MLAASQDGTELNPMNEGITAYRMAWPCLSVQRGVDVDYMHRILHPLCLLEVVVVQIALSRLRRGNRQKMVGTYFSTRVMY